MATSSEIWKDIAEFEGSYQVSDQGRVRSLDRLTCNNHRLKGRVLKHGVDGHGHHFVNLSVGGLLHRRKVHKLVLETFVGAPNGRISRHGIRGIDDNSVGNLCYGTPRENQLDRFRDHTIESKSVICSDGSRYISINQAAKETGLGRQHISAVCHGRRKSAGGFHWRFAV